MAWPAGPTRVRPRAGTGWSCRPGTCASLALVVHPAERQRGLGLALLRHAAGRAAAHGRAVLNGGARDGSAGEAFARSVGAKPGLVEVQRVLDPGQLEKGKLARLRGPAERAAAGYSLVSWAGPIPEEFIEEVAALYNAMGDAPRDPEIAPEEWDAQRVRERINPAPALRVARLHGGGATRRHRRTGGAERDGGGSGRSGLGVPDVYRRDQEAPRAPARAADEDRDDGAARHHRAAAGTDLDLERPDQRAHDRGQRGDRLHRLRPADHRFRLDVAAALERYTSRTSRGRPTARSSRPRRRPGPGSCRGRRRWPARRAARIP